MGLRKRIAVIDDDAYVLRVLEAALRGEGFDVAGFADPRDAHAQAGLLALRAPQADPVSTESQIKGLLAAGPEEGVLYFTLGNQYAQQGRWPEAQQSYARAVALEPENPDYVYNLAVSHEHLRRPEAALPLYHRALVLGLQRPAGFDPEAAQARIQALSR